MLKKATVSLLISGIMLASNIAQAKVNSKIYRIPEDVKCTSATRELFSEDEEPPISKKVTYCTDKEGNPLNGQMIKYYQGIALKRYPMKDGYLHGVGKVYYKNGKLKTAFNYEKGVLNGYVLEFDNKWTSGFNGNIIEKIPYVNGQREGIATYYHDTYTIKAIYQQDKLQGAAKMWDNKKKLKIYDFNYANDRLVSATYYYDAKEECEENCRKDYCRVQCDAEKLYKCVQKCNSLDGKTKAVEVSPVIIFATNYQESMDNKCFSFHESLSADKRPVKYNSSEACNKILKNNNEISEVFNKRPQQRKLSADKRKTNENRVALNTKSVPNPATTVPMQNATEQNNNKEVKKTPLVKPVATSPKTEAAQTTASAEQKSDKNQESSSASTDACNDLGLPGTYTIKENYQTKDKDIVCVAIKDNTENLLQYNKTKELLRIWAPKKACSKAEKILNPETCDASSLLYKFRMAEREIKPKKYSYGIMAGVYAYINQENKQETRKIPPLIIEGINQKCLVLQSVISYSACPFIATGSSKECNQMWRQQHREEVLMYIKGCKAASKKS